MCHLKRHESFVALLQLSLLLQFGTIASAAQDSKSAGLFPRLKQIDGIWTAELFQGAELIGKADAGAPAGLEIRTPQDDKFRPLLFREKRNHGEKIELGPTDVGPLSYRLEFEPIGRNLVRRTLVVTARDATQFAAKWSLLPNAVSTFASFSREEPSPVICDSLGGGPEYSDIRGESIPVAMARDSHRVIGVLADSPGLWENRCLVEINPVGRRLAVMCGDGRPPRELRIVNDARDAYVGKIDGWQTLAAGETRRFNTWIFTSLANSHYDAQLATHLAVAQAKRWNSSALEAILRNTAYFNIRRNLLRNGQEKGKYIFISGIGYGWKQWVSDAFWQAVALDDPGKLVESLDSVFLNRITYEDNAQYYLIWSALAKRLGHTPNVQLVQAAYEFIRKHETDGVFIPPPLPGAPKPKGWKTYMDVLEYDDDDAPVSNQGFHCGALLAARELGLPVATADIDRAIAGYRRMFNAKGGYFPTSIKQSQHIGQDTLYGAALTFAVFGKKLLDDEQVLTHWRTSQKIASPFGLRVISLADGNLLPGHSGSYVYGGSWFLNDAANHLLAELHGLPPAETDTTLITRIKAELAHAPAFHESISTVTGKPHGHINYSWNSGYWWLRKQFRERQAMPTADPVAMEIDKALGVIHDVNGLTLDPSQATLRPKP